MKLRHGLALAILTQTVGCASIVGGVNQSISVQTEGTAGPVVGATCKLENKEGTWFVTTPGSTTVHRSGGDLAVNCDKETYPTATTAAASGFKALALGNVLFGGLIGIGVDLATGAAWDYPELITVLMGESHSPIASPDISPSESSAAAPTPVAASDAATASEATAASIVK